MLESRIIGALESTMNVGNSIPPTVLVPPRIHKRDLEIHQSTRRWHCDCRVYFPPSKLRLLMNQTNSRLEAAPPT